MATTSSPAAGWLSHAGRHRQPVHGLAILVGHPVGVGINRQSDGAGPHLPDVDDRLAVLDQQGGKLMPQVMKAYAPQPGSVQAAVKVPVTDIVHVHGVARLVAEHPVGDFSAALC